MSALLPRALGALAVAATLTATSSAHAQAVRTWISGVGDDANPCSRTAPCQTFTNTISKTAIGGIVSVLDHGEFGPVTITRSLTIDGISQTAAASDSMTSGVTIDVGPTDTVVLRDLSVRGEGTGTGIRILGAGRVLLSSVHVSNFAVGIDAAPTGALFLGLEDVTSTGHVTAALRASGATTPAFVNARRSFFDQSGVGVLGGAGARVSLFGGAVTGNGAGVAAQLGAGGGVADVNVEDVTVSNNGVGVRASATTGTAVVRLSNVIGTGNAQGATGIEGVGQVLSFGNNRLDPAPALLLTSTAPSPGPAGSTFAVPLALTVQGLLVAPITFTCEGLPAGATCAFAPDSLPATTTKGTLALSVKTAAPTTAWLDLRPGSRGAGTLLLVPALGLGLVLARKRRGGALAVLALLVATTSSACGSDGEESPADPTTQPPTSTPDGGPVDPNVPPPGGTPKGSHVVKVVAHSGTLTGTTDVTIDVR